MDPLQKKLGRMEFRTGVAETDFRQIAATDRQLFGLYGLADDDVRIVEVGAKA